MNNYIIKLKQILQIFLNYFDYSLKSELVFPRSYECVN